VFFVSICILDLTVKEGCNDEDTHRYEVNMLSENQMPEETAASPQSDTSGKVMKWGMAVCCSVMLIPVAAFLIGGGTIAGLWSNASVFAPIALCVGAHVLMFKMMGKSCHAPAKKIPAEKHAEIPVTATNIPAVRT
jgi:hypothetical protein